MGQPVRRGADPGPGPRQLPERGWAVRDGGTEIGKTHPGAGHFPDRELIDRTFDLRAGKVYPGLVAIMQADRARYQARPGRRAVVVADLADLHGPTGGTMALPLWLFWSCPDHAFDLGDRDMRLWFYQTVLREAARPEDLAAYLDGGTLVALWPDLYLPKGVRQAWEEQHPALRAAATTAAA